MSGKHYSKHVLQLEEILSNRIAQLVLLETENARLKQKERALQSCILGIEGSVAATRAVLEVEAGLESLSGKVDSSRSGDAGCVNTVSSDSCGAAAGTSGVDQTFNSPGSAAAQAVLQALEAKEQQVQAALAQLGCCNSSYSELYSARLLRRATADPAHALAIVNMTRSERLQFLVRMVQKMALLLPKYDSNAPGTSLGSAREQLHAVVDELSERILVAGLLDPPEKKLGNLLINLETMEFERYPQGYWSGVALSLHLTDDQKAALKVCWARVKANKAALTEQHSRLSERLELLQLRQQQVQLEFEQQAAHLQDLQLPYGVQQKRRTKEAQSQQRQASQSQQHQPASESTQQPSSSAAENQALSPPEVQQQQAQAQALLTPTVQQQQQVYVPVVTGLHQPAMHVALQQMQPVRSGGTLLQQTVPTELLQQSSGLFSSGPDSSAGFSCSNLGLRRSVHWQQQLSPSSAVPTIPAAAAAAAPAVPVSLQLPAAGSCTFGAIERSPVVSGDLMDMVETSRSSFGSAMSNPEGMLLPVSSKEQRDIEQQLAIITEKLKMQHFCQSLQFHNVLTYKQLAGIYVNAWPFVPDAFSVCEALDELDWQ